MLRRLPLPIATCPTVHHAILLSLKWNTFVPEMEQLVLLICAVSLQISYFQHETKTKMTCFLFLLDLLATSPFLTF